MECYDVILKMYRDNELVEQSRVLDVKTNKCIINLMKKLENKTKDKTDVKNCLILLINLFFNLEYPDHYHTKGKDFESLSDKEKGLVFNMLKDEFAS